MDRRMPLGCEDDGHQPVSQDHASSNRHPAFADDDPMLPKTQPRDDVDEDDGQPSAWPMIVAFLFSLVLMGVPTAWLAWRWFR